MSHSNEVDSIITAQIPTPFPDGEIAHDADDEQIKKVHEYAKAIFNKFAEAVCTHTAKKYLYEFLDNPKAFLIVINHWMGSLETYLPPYLSECACVNSENFNRFKTTRRVDIENQMLNDIQKLSPISDNFTLRYLNLGAGKLLQDFINVGKLMRAGYKNIDVVLVDPQFHENYDTESYRLNPQEIEQHKQYFQNLKRQFDFLSAAANEQGITLNISYIDSISKATGNFHIIQMIDFDDFKESFKDMLLAHELLDTNGRLYLSFGITDLIFDKSQCVNYKIHKKQETPMLDKIESVLCQEAQKMGKKELNIAFLSDENDLLQWMEYLRKMAQVEGVEKINLTLAQPQKRSFFGNAQGENEQFTKEGLEKFLSLLTGKTIVVTLIQSFDDFKKLNQKYDIITQLFVADYKTTIESNLLWLRKNHLESSMFFTFLAFEKTKKEYTMAWKGCWKWDKDQGVNFLEEPNRQNRAKIDLLMAEPTNSWCSVS